MECFKILEPGLFTTIQDLGRFGYESQGVPTSGAMDEFAFRVANRLLENEENDACLEITLVGPTLEALTDTFVAVTGAEMQPLVNDIPRPMWSSFPVRKGDIISFSPIKSGLRVYLAVKGGFKGDYVMGSVSTYTRGKLGGFKGRRLEKGDILEKNPSSQASLQAKKVRERYIPSYSSEEEVRVILGPQDDYFEEEAIKVFLTSSYIISKDSDRMGYRLEGPFLKAKERYDIVSDGLLPGAVQVPANGQPIVILKDAQTTGGYTKIATVISSDLSKIAQLKPGDRIRFKAITLEEAHRALEEMEKLIDEIEISAKEIKYFTVKVDKESFDVSVEPF
ncbi:KipI antagonist [Thermoanaerobacter sp. YS13]|uniref:5-oxoprolinase subunit C family protein n=1 Tax=Thermoanaerobacter sp. YS13 TaxID=1511746 RepID=UPI000574C933|nr:biotin-dependent carboxyltransferase family protein [Thermoanaerobacter sp. YS13]KHO62764.1 KipI antagonist [Thermoanaerobacter sp. YS13]